MTCTCSFLATVEGIHEWGCALQCANQLTVKDPHDFFESIGRPAATWRVARCGLGADHSGDHIGGQVTGPVRIGPDRRATSDGDCCFCPRLIVAGDVICAVDLDWAHSDCCDRELW